jgi:hypothetical protein
MRCVEIVIQLDDTDAQPAEVSQTAAPACALQPTRVDLSLQRSYCIFPKSGRAITIHTTEQGLLDGQAQLCFAAASVATVLQRQRATVGFCNLAAEDETDAGTTLFCREEGNEEVCRV